MERNGGDKRGKARDRRRRRQWLVAYYGNGETCLCAHGCGAVLTVETLEVDRKIPGGSYARWNIQPSCKLCNVRAWPEQREAAIESGAIAC